MNAFNNCNLFEKGAQLSVVVDVDNEESINDLQLRSRLVFFSVSVKVLPVTPLVSGVFVHRAFCAYFRRIERVVELRKFLWWTQ